MRVFPGSLPKKENGVAEVVNGEKAHLIYLIPDITDCISTKEAGISNAIKEILLEIGQVMMGESVNTSLLPDE